MKGVGRSNSRPTLKGLILTGFLDRNSYRKHECFGSYSGNCKERSLLLSRAGV